GCGSLGEWTNNAGASYAGLNVEEARKKVVAWLGKSGLLEKTEDTMQNVGTSDRFGDVVEPLPKTQWFIEVNKKFKIRNSTLKTIKKGQLVTLKQLMQTVVKTGDIKIIPERFDKTYFHWIDNLRDWNISRQIWYGHRVPVWYCAICSDAKHRFKVDITGEISEQKAIFSREKSVPMVSINQPEKCKKCGNTDKNLILQDSDTLDTWFSSGSWTFSTLGWPRTTVGFVRHGEAENNVQKVVHDDIEGSNLTEKGRKQVADLAKKIKKENFEIIVASPVLRARQTAEILAEKLGLSIEFFDDRIREVGFGKLDRHTEAEIEKERNAKGWMVKTPFGMESYVSLRKRTHEFMEELVAKHPGKRILVVSHGDTLGVLKQFGTDLYTNDVSPTQDKATCDTRHFANNGNQSDDLVTFHPTSVLETGYDILFFWVARMILMSTYALGEVPFKTVYLHGLVRDEEGRKMSKSLGNIIDPLDMIKKYGTDATRLSLLIGGTPGNDMRLSEEKIAGFRNFTNKLWNISRFMLLNIQEPVKNITKPKAKTAADEWILWKLESVISQSNKSLNAYQFSLAGEILRDFTWGELADWYLEIAKVEGGKNEILNYILNTILKLWHPFMPFVTEQIWQEIYNGATLMTEEYPVVEKGKKETDNIVFIDTTLRNIITKIRSIRTEYKIEPAKKIVVSMRTKVATKMLAEYIPVLIRLAGIETISNEKIEKAVSFSESGVDVQIDLSSAIDTAKEKTRIEKEIASVEPYVLQMEKKLSNKEFVKNAPKVVVEKEQQKLEESKQKLQALQNQLKQLTINN
ncbi:MAG TPA: class I tRNA ligase family protein, partial [Candidatus Magasanikbacteria bacterium]|nr:class I tRNA ligase family protein [Candidatus Magasanikbacteria bacterium]